MITGFTSNKLDVIRTYNVNNPFQVGVNGVTSVSTNNVTYTIGNINYSTELNGNFLTTFSTNASGYDFNPYIVFPNRQNTFDIKEEAKMGLVFPPKVSNELFIERQSTAVFERHSRLSEINNFGELENYRNGYYNIVQIT
jgi:hypothetical protein